MAHKFWTVPRIGMGCWAIGGPFWSGAIPVGYSGSNDRDSVAAIHAAWAAGVRVFDTSAVYGAGHSESLLGDALKGRADAVLISKFGHSFDPATKQMTGSKFDADYIRDSVEQSRQRLQRDKLDLLLLHLNDLPVAEAQRAFDTLDELVIAEKIDAYGWSTDVSDSLHTVAPRSGFIAVQHAMNLFSDAPAIGDVAEAHDLVQLNRSPLAMGALTGKFSKGSRLPKDDVRSNSRDWQGYFENSEMMPLYRQQLEALREIITVGGRTLAQGALCWLLAKSARTFPLPGAKNAHQAEENAAAVTFGPLPAEVMSEVEAVLKSPFENPPQTS